MASLLVASSLLTVAAGSPFDFLRRSEAPLITDIKQISSSWGQLSSYSENPNDIFGVKNVGMPPGCQIVSTSQKANEIITNNG